MAPPVPGKLSCIAVGSAWEIWGVYNGAIFKREGDNWTPVSGPPLSQISAASDGSVWGITATGEIHRRNGSNWDPVEGTLTCISVGSSTQVWGVNSASGRIFQWNPHPQPGQKPWTDVTGPAMIGISISADGSVWAVGADKKAYLRRGQDFMPAFYDSTHQPGGPDFTQISVGSSAQIWAVNSATGEICLWS